MSGRVETEKPVIAIEPSVRTAPTTPANGPYRRPAQRPRTTASSIPAANESDRPIRKSPRRSAPTSRPIRPTSTKSIGAKKLATWG